MRIDASTRYAGFGRRLAAMLIDGVLFSVVSAILLYPINPDLVEATAQAKRFDMIEFFITNVLPALLSVFCWVRFMATPGKMVMGCQVVDADSGKHLRPGQAVVRYLAYYISLLPLALGFFWILWDKRKQGFHDKLAGTVVVLSDVRVLEDDESQKSLDQLMSEVR